jgi:hypothetical protein
MMRHWIIIFVLLCSPAWAATYYVDNCVTVGSDSNNGTSTATAWLTVAHVNAQTFSAGDSVLFQSTCEWREELIAPSSGSSGNVITFGAYGTGAQPVITGFSVLNSWTNYPETLGADLWNSAASQFTSGTYAWAALDSNVMTNDGTTGNPAPSLKCVYVGDTSGCGDYFANNANGGDLSSNLTIGNVYKVVMDAKVSFVPTTIQMKLGFGPPSYLFTRGPFFNSTSWTTYISPYFTADNATLDAISPIGMVPLGTVWFDNMHLYPVIVPGGTPGTYYAALGSQPTVVTYNGTALSLTAGDQHSLNANEYIWVSGDLYVNVGGSPASNSIEVSARADSFDFNQKSYVTINGLTFTGASTYSVQNSTSGSNNTVENSTIFNAYEGMWITTSGGNFTAVNNVIHDLNDYGIQVTSTGAGYVFEGNTIYNIGTPRLGDTTDMQGIYLNATGGTIQNNLIYNGGNVNNGNGAGATEHCIYYGGSNINVGYNVLHDFTGTGFKTAGCATCNVYYNLVYHNGYIGAQLYGGSSNVNFFSNVFYNNGWGQYGTGGFHLVNQGGASSNITLNNNIFLNNINVAVAGEQVTVDASSVTGFAEDYDILFSSVGTDIAQYGGTDYSWSGWQGIGYDTHGVNADPLFTSASGGVFTLQSGSPAIGAALNLGPPYQNGLNPAYSTWINGLVTAPQSASWNIGAFVSCCIGSLTSGAAFSNGTLR